MDMIGGDFYNSVSATNEGRVNFYNSGKCEVKD